MMKFSLTSVFILALVGCASQPSVYYTLTAPAANQQLKSTAVVPIGLYSIVSVSVPAPVDDTLIIVRQSDDRLMKLAHDRWTAPLGKQFGNALAVALTDELGMPPISTTQAALDAKVTNISVDVQRFDLLPGQFAELAAVWQVSVGSIKTGSPNLICYTVVRQSVEPGVAPLVQAQQMNIQKLAKAISLSLQTGQPYAGTQCQ